MDVLADEWSVKNNNWFSLFTLRYHWESGQQWQMLSGASTLIHHSHHLTGVLARPVRLSYESLMMWVWWWWPGTDQKLHNGQESHDPPNLRFLDCRMGSIMEGPIKRGNTSYHYTPTHHSTERERERELQPGTNEVTVFVWICLKFNDRTGPSVLSDCLPSAEIRDSGLMIAGWWCGVWCVVCVGVSTVNQVIRCLLLTINLWSVCGR